MTDTAGKVVVFGAGGRVGLALTQALLQHRVNVIAVDFLPQQRLEERISRVTIDAGLTGSDSVGRAVAHGGVDVLDEGAVTALLAQERPDVVINYAIPFTWDATRQLPNYERISSAGLGAFAAVQVLAPSVIARAIAASGIDVHFIVGNLPDITVPIIHGLSRHQTLALPVAGAGNVGLIEAGIRHQVAIERGLEAADLDISLVAHHVHWVAPREPGYPNDAPFLLEVCHRSNDITAELGDPRELMNEAIVRCYEAGAGFSSTTGLLAARLTLALLDRTGAVRSMHVPAPNGLPGGYPVTVTNGQVALDLPPEWQPDEAVGFMSQAHQRDGIEAIAADGTIHFDTRSVAILKSELGIDLPPVLAPHDLESVAREQIRLAQAAVR
jgi:hypothetical protein